MKSSGGSTGGPSQTLHPGAWLSTASLLVRAGKVSPCTWKTRGTLSARCPLVHCGVAAVPDRNILRLAGNPGLQITFPKFPCFNGKPEPSVIMSEQKTSSASNKFKAAALHFDYSFTPNWPHLILWRTRSRYLLQCNYSHIQNIGKCKQYRISTWWQINLVWCFPLGGLKGLQFWKYPAVCIYNTMDVE